MALLGRWVCGVEDKGGIRREECAPATPTQLKWAIQQSLKIKSETGNATPHKKANHRCDDGKASAISNGTGIADDCKGVGTAPAPSEDTTTANYYEEDDSDLSDFVRTALDDLSKGGDIAHVVSKDTTVINNNKGAGTAPALSDPASNYKKRGAGPAGHEHTTSINNHKGTGTAPALSEDRIPDDNTVPTDKYKGVGTAPVYLEDNNTTRQDALSEVYPLSRMRGKSLADPVMHQIHQNDETQKLSRANGCIQDRSKHDGAIDYSGSMQERIGTNKQRGDGTAPALSGDVIPADSTTPTGKHEGVDTVPAKSENDNTTGQDALPEVYPLSSMRGKSLADPVTQQASQNEEIHGLSRANGGTQDQSKRELAIKIGRAHV
jgi:hypothetical protein